MLRRRRAAKRCRELLATLSLPDPLDTRELCRQVGATRGRRIVLAPLAISAAGFSGLWLATDTTDYICFEENTSRHHQDQIILHELGHILFGHAGSETLDRFFSQLGDGALRIMLARRHEAYNDDQELEAETFAYLAQSDRGRVGEAPPDDPGGRLGRVLEV
jgi:Zn-dependent peptidase ImmA (M78 family)